MKYELSGDMIMENIDGTSVATNSRNGDAAVFNEMAGVILELLLESQDLDATVASIIEKYDVDEQTARADISELMTDLEARGILICGDTSA